MHSNRENGFIKIERLKIVSRELTVPNTSLTSTDANSHERAGKLYKRKIQKQQSVYREDHSVSHHITLSIWQRKETN